MNIKKLLPFENYILTTPLSPEEVYKRIYENIEPKSLRFILFNAHGTKPYEGEISGNTFNINRIIDYQNSFLPRINGNISTSAG